MQKQNPVEERRKHRRFKLSPHIIEPLQIKLKDYKDTIPGIIVDLSAGGIAIITYENIPVGTHLDISFNLVGLKLEHIKGEVARVREHSNTYLIVLTFNKLQKEVEHKIEEIAMDYEDCETKWKRGDTDICNKKCNYYMCCTKSIKK